MYKSNILSFSFSFRLTLALLTSFFLTNTSLFAQVKIGDNPLTISPNAILELESNNKGVIFTRVQLTGTLDNVTVGAHTTGMVVYNTSTTSGVNSVEPGFYYNDGTQWILFAKSSSTAVSGNDSLLIRNDSLLLSNGKGLPINLINTDTQRLSISGSDLSISGGNTITLPTASGNNNQDLSINNDSLLISGGAGLKLSDISTDTQRLSISGSDLSISGGNTITLPTAAGSNNQDLSINNDSLLISGGSGLKLSDISTDTQRLSISGSDLSISGGNTITLPTSAGGSDSQDLSIGNDSLLISGGDGLKLSDISTDTQRLSISGSDLSISGGNTITLPTATGGSDSQDLGKLNDSILTISSGDSVALSEFLYLPSSNVNTYGENPDVNKGYSATQGTGTAVAAGDAKRGWATSSQAQPIKDFLKYFDITDAQVTEITNNINSAQIKFYVRDRRLSQSARIASTGYISFTSLNNSEIISTLGGFDFKFRASYDVGLKTIKIEDNHFKEATYTNNYGSVYGLSVRVSTGLLLTNTGSRLKGLVNENTLSISGSDLSISGGNTITLPTASGSNNQDLSINNDSLLISGGDGLKLSDISTDTQRLSISGSDLSISGGNTITLPTATGGSDSQDLSIRNDSLLISGGSGLKLSDISTDTQRLSISGSDLSISGGNTITLPTAAGSNNQDLSINNDSLLISGGSGLKLSDISTDTQRLSISGSDLSISGGNTITLPTAAGGSDSQDLSIGNDSLLISGGSGLKLSDISTDTQRLSISGSDLSISGGNTITLPTAAGSNNQDLSINNDSLLISGGDGLKLSEISTDTQKLSISGSDLSISGGNTITLPTSAGGSDSQDLGKLNDSILTISSGDSVALSEFLYLPSSNVNTYGENPDVNKGYSATQGTGTAVAAGDAKRGWATSSQAQPIKDFLKYFDITDAQVTEITNNINSAQIRFYVRDRRLSQSARIASTGYISFTSLNNSEIISTLNGADFKFRASYDVGLKTIKIEDNHFKEATYTNNYGSVYGLSVRVSTGLMLTNTGSRLKGLVNENTLSISGSDLSISGGNTITLPTAVGGSDSQDLSIRNDSLLISGGSGLKLSDISTDTQRLSISGSDLSISGGNTITLPTAAGGSDSQDLSIGNDSLLISGGSGLKLSDISTDTQRLSISGSDLSISGGNTITLPTAAGSNNQDLSINNDSLLISGGSGLKLSDISTDTQRLSISGSDLSISGGNTITLPTSAGGSDSQDLSIGNDSLLISGGDGLKLSDISTDTQRLSISGSDLSISGGNTITLPTATGGSDSQDLGKLNDSILTISSGDSVALSEFLYLPSSNVNTYGENPDVNKGYSATQGTGTAVAAGDAKRGWATSSQAQPIKDFLKYFDITDAQVTEITNNINSAQIKFYVRDRRLSQSARIASTGYISFTSLNNSEIISTLNGADFKFRASYDVGLKTIKIEDNHFQEATYTNNYGSVYGVSVRVSTGLLLTNTGSRLKGLVNENTLSISGSDLSISGGNTITLPTASGSNNQDLSINNDSLLISGGDGLKLSDISTDTQRLSISGSDLSISGGNTITLPTNTDNQSLTLTGRALSIDRGNSITLPTDLDNQDLSINNDSLLISGGSGLKLSDISTDTQRLSISGSDLSISGGNTITLPTATGGSDSQDLSIRNDSLLISGGSGLKLSDISTDTQRLSISGSDLSISGGNTITLPTAAGSNNQDLSINNDSLLISGGDGLKLSDISTDTQRLSISGSDLSISGGNTITLPTSAGSNNQDLSINNDSLLISGGSGLKLSDISTDTQRLSISGSDLSISGGNTITLPTNTDNQSLTLSGRALSIDRGNSITLPTDLDNQDLSIRNDSLLISGGSGLKLSDISTDTQRLSISGSDLSISGGNTITLPTSAGGSDSQDLSINNDSLLISSGAGLKLSDISTDTQRLSISGSDLSISGGNTITLPTNTDNQSLTLRGRALIIDRGNSITLPTDLDSQDLSIRNDSLLISSGAGLKLSDISTDTQRLSISGSDLSITGGNTITLPTNTDNQSLTLSGRALSIDRGNSITLPTDLDSQDLSINNDSLLISGGAGLKLSDISTDTQRLSIIGSDLSISGGNTITLPTNTDNQSLTLSGRALSIDRGNSITLPTDLDNQDLSIRNDSLLIRGGVGLKLSDISTDTQRLSIIGSDLSISGGNTITLPTATGGSDSQDLGKLNDSILTISSGDSVALSEFLYKEVNAVRTYGETPVLNKAYNATLGTGTLSTGYGWATSSQAQPIKTFLKYFGLTSLEAEQTVGIMSNTNSEIKFYVRDRRDGFSSRKDSTGYLSLNSLNNTVIVSALDGADFKFRASYDASAQTIKIEDNHFQEATYTNNYGSVYGISVRVSKIVSPTNTGDVLKSLLNENRLSIIGSDLSISGGNTITLPTATGGSDSQDLGKLNDSILTISSGDSVALSEFLYKEVNAVRTYGETPVLNKAYNATLGTGTLSTGYGWATSSQAQPIKTFLKYFGLTSLEAEQTVGIMSNTNSEIKFYVRDRRDGFSSRKDSTGYLSLNSLNNTVIVSALDGADFKFRASYDASAQTIKIEDNHFQEATYTNNYGSVYGISVRVSKIVSPTNTGDVLKSLLNENRLSIIGSDLSISGGNTITLPTATGGSDSQDLGKKNDSLLTISNGGDSVALSEFLYKEVNAVRTYGETPVLNKAYNATLGTGTLSTGYGWATSSQAQPIKTFLKYFGLTSLEAEQTVGIMSNTNSEIKFYVRDRRDGFSSRKDSTGYLSLNSLNNTVIVSALDGADFKFRASYDASAQTIKIEDNHFQEATYTNNYGSVYGISVRVSKIVSPTNTGDVLKSLLNENRLSIIGSDLSISGGNTITLPTATGGSDSQDLGKKNDSLLTISNGGDSVALSEFLYKEVNAVRTYGETPVLNKAYNATLGTGTLSTGYGWATSSQAQPIKTFLKYFGLTSLEAEQTVGIMSNTNSEIKFYVRDRRDGFSSRKDSTGYLSLNSLNNTVIVSALDGADFKFRASYDASAQTIKIEDNHFQEATYTNNYGSVYGISVRVSKIVSPTNTGDVLKSLLNENRLSIIGSDLSISGGNTITLPTATGGSDSQDLSVRNDSLLISGGAGLKLSDISTDTQRLSIRGNDLSISGGNTITLPTATGGSDSQDLSIRNDSLLISGGAGLKLSDISTDTQRLSIIGSDLSISGGNTITLPTATGGSDSQDLSIRNDSLLISGGTGLKLSDISTDTQRLSIIGSDLSISGGNTITLPTASGGGSDSQRLSISGSDLSISGGNTITLPTAAGSNNQNLGKNNDSILTISSGDSVAISEFLYLRGNKNIYVEVPVVDKTPYKATTGTGTAATGTNYGWATSSQAQPIGTFLKYFGITDAQVTEITNNINIAQIKFYLRDRRDGFSSRRANTSYLSLNTLNNTNVLTAFSGVTPDYNFIVSYDVGAKNIKIEDSYLDPSIPTLINYTRSGSNGFLNTTSTLFESTNNPSVKVSINTTFKIKMGGNYVRSPSPRNVEKFSIGGSDDYDFKNMADGDLVWAKINDANYVKGVEFRINLVADVNNPGKIKGIRLTALRAKYSPRNSNINFDFRTAGSTQALATSSNPNGYGLTEVEIVFKTKADDNFGSVYGVSVRLLGKLTKTGSRLKDLVNENTLSLSGSDLSISGGNSVTLPTPPVGSDSQDLSVRNDSLLISGGAGLKLSDISTDTQKLSLSGNDLSISGGNTITLPTAAGSNNQDLGKKNDSLLTISSGDSVALSEFLYLPSSSNFNTYGENPVVNKTPYNATTGTGTITNTGTNYGWATSSTAQPIKDFLKYFNVTDAQVTEITNNINIAEIKFYLRDRRDDNAYSNRRDSTNYLSFNTLNNMNVLRVFTGSPYYNFIVSYDVGAKTIKIEDSYFGIPNSYGSVYGVSVRVSTGLMLTNTGSRLKGLVNENTLSLSGSNLSISGGNTITLPSTSGGGGSSQDLAKKNDSLLTISGGGDSVAISEFLYSPIFVDYVDNINGTPLYYVYKKYYETPGTGRAAAGLKYGWATSSTAQPIRDFLKYCGATDAQVTEITNNINNFRISFYLRDRRVGKSASRAFTAYYNFNDLKNTNVLTTLPYSSPNYNFIVSYDVGAQTIKIEDSHVGRNNYGSVYGVNLQKATTGLMLTKTGSRLKGLVNENTLSLSGSDLSISGGNTITLPTNTDNQNLTLSGRALSIDRGNSITLPTDLDSQDLSIRNDSLLISGGAGLKLSDISTDTQRLSIRGNELSIGGGNSVILPTGTDNQSLTIIGSDLSISGGNTITLPTASGGGSDSQKLSISGSDLSISGGNTITLPTASGGGSDSQRLSISGSDLSISGGNTITLPTAAGSNNQNLGKNNDSILTISSGDNVAISEFLYLRGNKNIYVEVPVVDKTPYKATTGTGKAATGTNYGWATSSQAQPIGTFLKYFGATDAQVTEITNNINSAQVKFYLRDRRDGFSSRKGSTAYLSLNSLNKTNVLRTFSRVSPPDYNFIVSYDVGAKNIKIEDSYSDPFTPALIINYTRAGSNGFLNTTSTLFESTNNPSVKVSSNTTFKIKMGGSYITDPSPRDVEKFSIGGSDDYDFKNMADGDLVWAKLQDGAFIKAVEFRINLVADVNNPGKIKGIRLTALRAKYSRNSDINIDFRTGGTNSLLATSSNPNGFGLTEVEIVFKTKAADNDFGSVYGVSVRLLGKLTKTGSRLKDLVNENTLSVSGNDLSISGGNTIILPLSGDTQRLSISGRALSIDRGNSITLPTDLDSQDLSIKSDSLLISGGKGAQLTKVYQNSFSSDTLIRKFPGWVRVRGSIIATSGSVPAGRTLKDFDLSTIDSVYMQMNLGNVITGNGASTSGAGRTNFSTTGWNRNYGYVDVQRFSRGGTDILDWSTVKSDELIYAKAIEYPFVKAVQFRVFLVADGTVILSPVKAFFHLMYFDNVGLDHDFSNYASSTNFDASTGTGVVTRYDDDPASNFRTQGVLGIRNVTMRSVLDGLTTHGKNLKTVVNNNRLTLSGNRLSINGGNQVVLDYGDTRGKAILNITKGKQGFIPPQKENIYMLSLVDTTTYIEPFTTVILPKPVKEPDVLTDNYYNGFEKMPIHKVIYIMLLNKLNSEATYKIEGREYKVPARTFKPKEIIGLKYVPGFGWLKVI